MGEIGILPAVRASFHGLVRDTRASVFLLRLLSTPRASRGLKGRTSKAQVLIAKVVRSSGVTAVELMPLVSALC